MMNDRNFYERRLGNPGYDAVARKKIKQLEKAVFGGTEMVEKVVFDSASAELNFMDMGAYTTAILPAGFNLKAGKTYTVYLDGKTYERTAFETPLGGNDTIFVMLGNAGLDPLHGLENTGEPFAFGIGDGMKVMAITSGMPTEIKITTMEEQSVGGSGGVMFVVNLYWDKTGKPFCDKTLDEIVTAFNNGMLPVMVDPELYLYNLIYKPDAEEGAVFVMADVLPDRAEVVLSYMQIYPNGNIRSAALTLTGELNYDDGEPGKPV